MGRAGERIPWGVGRLLFRSPSEKTACDAENGIQDDSGKASDHLSTSKLFDDLSTCTG